MPKGLIISNVSNIYEVEDFENKKIVKCIPRGKLKKDDIIPAVGDNIEFEYQAEDSGVINQIYPRKNYIKRPKMANLTQMIFVISMKMPKPDLLLLDKQLAFAEFNNIKSIICVNKVDLEDSKYTEEIFNMYKKIGYRVIKTNAKNGQGVDELCQILKDNVTAFSGNSGVGKSTLINSIFKGFLTLEGELSNKNKRGKNTTTAIKLYRIDDNSYIADTPGFSTFEIHEIESKNLIDYFIDLSRYIENCKYIGCTHVKEEKCGVKEAVEEGLVSAKRYETYCRLFEELKEKELHKW